MPGNRTLAVAMQEKRRSSATSRHASPRDYNRTKAKAALRRGDW
jgi:hypothetical protein